MPGHFQYDEVGILKHIFYTMCWQKSKFKVERQGVFVCRGDETKDFIHANLYETVVKNSPNQVSTNPIISETCDMELDGYAGVIRDGYSSE